MPTKVRISRNTQQRNPVRLATRRRKRRIILAAVALLFLGILICGAIYIIHLPAFSIQKIEVSGAHDVSDAAIRQYAETLLDDGQMHIIPKRMILAYPKIAIAAGLREQFPRLSSASVSRPSLFSTTLAIAVAERSLYAAWCAQPGAASCYDMDTTGFLYAPLDLATSTGYITFYGGVMKPESPIGLYMAPDYFDQVKQFISGMTAAGFHVQSFAILSDKDFDAVLDTGLHVRGSFDYAADDMIGNLTAAMGANSIAGKEDSLEYIDLRFGNRVYFKFKQ
jgi:cell division septal protein FtsQ